MHLFDHLSFARLPDSLSPLPSSSQQALNELLTSFQGVAEFFLDYMFSLPYSAPLSSSSYTPIAANNNDNDNESPLHTGPTTSPETSFGTYKQAVEARPEHTSAAAAALGAKKEKEKWNAHQLSLSPALDCSVLRYVFGK